MIQPKAKKRHFAGAAEVLEVHDGDTFKALIDLGCEVAVRKRVRVRGVNTPELPTFDGVQAKIFLASILKPGAIVFVDSRRLDLHGRLEAIVKLEDESDLASIIIAAGHGVPADDRGNI